MNNFTSSTDKKSQQPSECVVKPLSVMLLISSLEYGGAERQVVELTRNFDRAHVNPFICSLSSEVPLAKFLENPERDLEIVEKKHKYDISTIWRVAKIMKHRKVDVVHALMFDAEMVARFAAPLAKVPVLICSERNSDYEVKRIKSILFRLTNRTCSGVIANSHAGKDFYAKTFKYPANQIHVVYNGIDVHRFKPRIEAKQELRKQLDLPIDTPILGYVGSFKRQKRHDYFLRMARAILDQEPNIHFVLVGAPLSNDFDGSHAYSDEIKALIEELDLMRHCHLLGAREDIENAYNGFDIKVLTSSREGTPNVLLEAMSCGIPVIATDVADNSRIVKDGETGYIVHPGDINALTDRALRLLRDSKLREQMSQAGREHVTKEFSLGALVQKTEKVYRSYLH